MTSSAVIRCKNKYQAEFVGPVTGFTYKIAVDAIFTIHKDDATALRELYMDERGYDILPVI